MALSGPERPFPGASDLVPLDVARDDPRIASLAAAYAERFRPFCSGMPDDAFARLCEHAAWIRLRWP